MNVLAIYMANELLQGERDRAFERAFAHGMPDAPSLRDRIASAAAGLRRLVGSPVATTPLLPKLGDNPYRN